MKDALEHKPDWILLDNFSISDMVRAVKIAKQKAKLEASGGKSDLASQIRSSSSIWNGRDQRIAASEIIDGLIRNGKL